ncbi:hypothetical protein RGQ29_004337 [Quercus rubra]|uniref:C3H1-type domain-containing protein n=1 Tax=Quercus rubra TaxID=3512 RepID=A0AAN7EEF2_QUERU|nr:hypothetical protein RGQ29_004337 [Quercus rubra]
MMGSSESTSVPNSNPNTNGLELGFDSSQSPNPNPDLDNQTLPDPKVEELNEKLERLDLKEEPESKKKSEDEEEEEKEEEKDGSFVLKEVEREKSDLNEEEEEEEEKRGGGSEWSYGNEDENENEVVIGIDKVILGSGGGGGGGSGGSGSGDEGEKKGERNGGGKKFQYQFPVRPEAEDCSFYLKTGTCKFGSNCRFNHPVKRKNQATKDKVKEKEELAERPGQLECKYYLRSGGCKFGKACRYNHTRGKTTGSTFLELNFLGLPIRPGEKECPYYMRTGSCKYGANCKFNHPDPTAVAGGDPSSGFGNGVSVSLGASQSSVTSWSPPRAMNENSPFVPVVLSPTPGVPPQNSDWNGYQEQDICAHYGLYGICKFGPACKFDHPIDPPSSPMTGVDQHSSYGISVTTENAGVAGSGSGSGIDATLQQPV